MKRPSVLIFLIFAFVGGNLLMGIASNPRSVKNSTGTRTCNRSSVSGQAIFLFFPLISLFVRLLFSFFFSSVLWSQEWQFYGSKKKE